MRGLEVLRGGAATTVQDAGRQGQAAFGLPVSGTMDRFAAAAANRLVGNPPGAALLEMLLRGPRVRATALTRVALVGARFAASLDGRPVVAGERFTLPAGAELDLGDAQDGARALLAVAGGLDVPRVLGSRATYLRGGLGGWHGRTLRAGDRLSLGEEGGVPALRGPWRPFAPRLGLLVARVLLGPQWDLFSAAAREQLFTAEFRVSPRSDRVGVRLEGPPLAPPGGSDIRPEPAWPGAMQVPGSGEAIVLGPDHPTTGGYAKLATVIAADLGAFAYLRPGERVRFKPCSLAEARAALVERERESGADEGRP